MRGIYKITNTITKKSYIGQSMNTGVRITKHKQLLKNGKHTNHHLLSSYKKYGIDCFVFEIIFRVDNEMPRNEAISILNAKEKELIIIHNTFKNGYNLTTGGNNCLASEETRLKLKMSHIGKGPSEEARRLAIQKIKGIPKSTETRARMSASSKGKKKSFPPWNIGLSGYKTKPCSDERKKKISLAQVGQLNHNYGKKISEEAKQKNRDSYHGTQCHLAKLDDKTVLEIKIALSKKVSGLSLARLYGVHIGTISKINKGKTWKHVKI